MERSLTKIAVFFFLGGGAIVVRISRMCRPSTMEVCHFCLFSKTPKKKTDFLAGKKAKF